MLRRIERAVVGLSLAGVIAGLTLLAAAPAADPAGRLGASCTRGAVLAIIAAKHLCLKAGSTCTARFERQYAKYGFRCDSRLLAKPQKTTSPPAPGPVTTTPAVPPPQPSPFIGTWWSIDLSDGSLQQVTFGADGSMSFQDDSAHVCGGVAGYAMTTGAAVGNTWTANARATLYCPDNDGSVPGTLFQFTLNPDGTLTATGTPDRWTRTKP
jgi:hypothetical protein